MTKVALMIDFGSTYSKFTAVDLDHCSIVGQVTLPTNTQKNLINCYAQGKHAILKKIDFLPESIEEYFCSSAWGGFRMIAIGLTETLTTQAAKRAALGAGTRILRTYDYKLTKQQVAEIKQDDPDVILLTGGTDGGNSEIVCHNAQLLNQYLDSGVILFAGNNDIIPEIKNIFRNPNLTIYYTENVMPTVNVLNAEPVRQIARDIFMAKIIQSEGINEIAQHSTLPVIPTPSAVLKAAQLLADGYGDIQGIGPLLIIDVGGATTDVHSVGKGLPQTDDTFFEGLEEPYLKRTVEGDLGMRSSAQSLVDAIGLESFQELMGPDWSLDDIHKSIQVRVNEADYLARNAREKDFDNHLAAIASNLALTRHAGKIRSHATPTRTVFYQTGKDLRYFKNVLGTGGVIVHNSAPKKILHKACRIQPNVLKPISPECLVDKNYLISTLGILAQKYPEVALKLLKENILETVRCSD